MTARIEHRGAILFATLLAAALALPVRAERVFWTEFENGTVQRADLERSELAQLATGQEFPGGLALHLDGRWIYWANQGSNDIRRMSLKGTHLQSIVTTADVQYLQPLGVAIDPVAGKLYWTNMHGGQIQRSDLSGNEVETVLLGLPNPGAIAVDPLGGKIYWTDRMVQKIQRADLDGGGIEDLFTGVDSFGIAVDPETGTIYWTQSAPGSQGKILKADADGGVPQEILVGLQAPTAIALDTEHGRIYWTDAWQGIQRADLSGDSVEAVLSAPESFGLAIDPSSPPTEPGTVFTQAKISRTEGGWSGDPQYYFGQAVAGIGDLDGDGIDDLAVGDRVGFGYGGDAGAVWILLLNDDGSVRTYQMNVEGTYGPDRRLGRSLATIGDLDGDGTNELAVGLKDFFTQCHECGPDDCLPGDLDCDGLPDDCPPDDPYCNGLPDDCPPGDPFCGGCPECGDAPPGGDGFPGYGLCCDTVHVGVWVVFLNQDGTFAATEPVVGGGVGFGLALAPVGDLDGDGVPDLAVGDPDYGSDTGAVWILFLNPDGTEKSRQEIGADAGGLEGWLAPGDRFGDSLAWIEDLDDEDEGRLAVGAPGASQILLLSLDSDGTVDFHVTIGENGAPFDDALGWPMASPGDVDGDGVADLALGAPLDGEGGLSSGGAVWVLFLDEDGGVKSQQKIGEISGGFEGALDSYDRFGSAVASLGDLDGDGIDELAVGAPGDDDGAVGDGQFAGPGAVWLLYLNGVSGVDDDEDEDEDEDSDEPYGGSTAGWPHARRTDNGWRDLMAGDDLDDETPWPSRSRATGSTRRERSHRGQ